MPVSHTPSGFVVPLSKNRSVVDLSGENGELAEVQVSRGHEDMNRYTPQHDARL